MATAEISDSSGDRPSNYIMNHDTSELLGIANKRVGDIEQFISVLDSMVDMHGDHFLPFSIKIDVKQEKEYLSYNKEKLARHNLYVSVCGSTSAGKSTLLNALLGKSLMPSSVNRCTPCCILIQTTQDHPSYFKIDNDPKEYGLEKLKDKAEELRAGDDIYRMIDVYISQKEEQFDYLNLKHTKISLMDTPGCGQKTFKASEAKILKSDAFVFVVDSGSGFSQEVKDFFKRVVEKYNPQDFLIVFNKWDLVYQDAKDQVEKVKKEYKREVEGFLKEVNMPKADKLIEDSVFFLSSVHVKLLRECHSHEKVKECLTKTVKSNLKRKHNIFVCGGDGKGRSTVVNMLINKDLLPTAMAGTPSFISFERSNNNTSWIADGQGGDYKLEALEKFGRNQREHDVLNVYLEEKYWSQTNKNSLLFNNDIRIFDTPHVQTSNFEREMSALTKEDSFTLVIVISARRSYLDNQQTIQKCVSAIEKDQIGELTGIVLLVNKWDVAIDKQSKESLIEMKEKYIKFFAESCSNIQSEYESRKKVFFISLQNFQTKLQSLEAFNHFTTHLLQNGRDNFKKTKFEPVFQSLEKCSSNLMKKTADMTQKIETNINNLYRIQRIVNDFSFPRDTGIENRFSENYLMNASKTPVAVFLEVRNQIPNSMEDLKAQLIEFLNFCDRDYLENKKKEIKESVLEKTDDEEEKVTLSLLIDRSKKDIQETSINTEDFMQAHPNSYENIVPTQSFLQTLRRRWQTLDSSVLTYGLPYGLILGGFSAIGLMNDSDNLTRLWSIWFGLLAGAGILMSGNCAYHCCYSNTGRVRRQALKLLFREAFKCWCHDIQTQMQRTVSQHYIELHQSLSSSNEQLQVTLKRFEGRWKRSKEETMSL